MFDIASLARKFPMVMKPEQRLNFNAKAKWTLIILVTYFILGSITVWGIRPEAISRFDFLEIVFGSKFGSLITLGIGPIVTASIILQLLVGSKILNWNTQTPEGKAKFMGVQKLMAILFCFIEAIAYVTAGAIPPINTGVFFVTLVILQLAAGGLIIMLMDEVVSKWGFGSGISLFIAAGVAKTIFVRIFSPPLKEASGGIISAFVSSLGQGMPTEAFIALAPLIATIVVFLIVVFAQDVKIEIPMSFAMPFGKFGSRRWPLKFIYTSNIPVILTAAVVANIQLVGRLLYGRGITILGAYDASTGSPTSGLMLYLTQPNSVSLVVITVLGGALALLFAFIAIKFIKKYPLRMALVGGIVGLILGCLAVSIFNLPALTTTDVARSLIYMSMMMTGSVVFSIFWVMTSGMDAHSVAEQFKSASIMIPGFRHDPRIVEKVLNRYIPSLTVLGGVFVGFLAGFADLTSALGTGTGILLAVMIVYQLYEQIASQHMEDMHPALRKFMGE